MTSDLLNLWKNNALNKCLQRLGMPRLLFWIIHFFLVLSISFANVSQDLDLREANVTGVTFEQNNATIYRFNVKLYHDDDGEEGYTDFWVVETLNGTELGKRNLTHPHGTIEFNRSKLIAIPETINIVVVRGHDQIHGFGGQVILVNLETSELEEVDQGSDPMDFSDRTRINSTSATSTAQITGLGVSYLLLIIVTFTSFRYIRKQQL